MYGLLNIEFIMNYLCILQLIKIYFKIIISINFSIATCYHAV
jgi:hypothetical protein